MNKKDEKTPPDAEAFLAKADQFIKDNPAVAAISMCLLGYIALVGGEKIPEWAKGVAPVNPKTAGPWRGKGSFGNGFGPNKVRRK